MKLICKILYFQHNFCPVGNPSKKIFEQSNANVLWFSLIKILDLCKSIFSPDQFENLKNCSEDELALISSNLTLLQQHFLGNLPTYLPIYLPTYLTIGVLSLLQLFKIY